MRKFAVAATAVLAIAASTAVYAERQTLFHGHMRLTPEDRQAFSDARIAAVHAGLKLTPDQEKLWSPVEDAVRDFAKLGIDRANAQMGPHDEPRDRQLDPVTRLRERADDMAVSAAAMKKIADAADPLYKTLDDAQRRRLVILTHWDRRFDGGGWRHRWIERDRDREHRPDPDGRGPERL